MSAAFQPGELVDYAIKTRFGTDIVTPARVLEVDARRIHIRYRWHGRPVESRVRPHRLSKRP